MAKKEELDPETLALINWCIVQVSGCALVAAILSLLAVQRNQRSGQH